MAGRGVVYMVWGDIDEAILDRSRASIAEHHPELPVHVVRSPTGSLLDKARLFDVSPFAETLYLDMDTVVLGALDFGFEAARRTGLALCICECPWARRYGGLSGDLVEYNTGVMFFTRQARAVFKAWAGCAADIDSSIVFIHEGQTMRMPLNDQAGFANAVEGTGFVPFVLPLNWNFRPKWHRSWFGPIKIWHDYGAVPEPILANNRAQAAADAVIGFSVLREAG